MEQNRTTVEKFEKNFKNSSETRSGRDEERIRKCGCIRGVRVCRMCSNVAYVCSTCNNVADVEQGVKNVQQNQTTVKSLKRISRNQVRGRNRDKVRDEERIRQIRGERV